MLAVGLAALVFAGCTGISQPNGWGGPVIEGDTLYVNVDGDTLAALSVDGRQERWRFPDDRTDDIDIGGIYGEPALVGERLLVGGYDGNLYALDPAGGAVRWTAKTGGPIVGGTAIADDLALVGSGDGYLYAFEIDGGALRWRFDTGEAVWAAPSVVGDVVYVPSLNGTLHALRVADGTPIWPEPFEAAGLPAAAAPTEDLIIVGSMDKRIYALRKSDGSVVWEFKAGNWFWTTPLVQDGVVYAGNLDGSVYALAIADGSLKWKYDAGAPVRSRPVLGNGVLVVSAKDGIVHGIDAGSGKQAWLTANLGTTLYANLTLSDAAVYVRGENGALWSVQPSDGALALLRAKS